jgi:hypothetical protein
MSKEEDRFKHSKRIYQKETKIHKQEPHKFNKHHAMACGNPNCVMCANPRKTFGELTFQEQKLYQHDKEIEQ